MTIGLGVAIQRIKDRDDPGWSVALALSAPLAIWLLIYTKSKAALVMPVLVVVLFAILWKWRGPMARQSKRWFWIGMGIVALGDRGGGRPWDLSPWFADGQLEFSLEILGCGECGCSGGIRCWGGLGQFRAALSARPIARGVARKSAIRMIFSSGFWSSWGRSDWC